MNVPVVVVAGEMTCWLPIFFALQVAKQQHPQAKQMMSVVIRITRGTTTITVTNQTRLRSVEL